MAHCPLSIYFSSKIYIVFKSQYIYYSLVAQVVKNSPARQDWHVSPWVYSVWDSLRLLNLIDYFLFHVGEIFNYNLFKIFLIPFLFLFFFGDPYNSNIGVFDIVPEVSETILSSFHSFYFILLFRSYFHHFIFQLTDLFFCFRYSVINVFLKCF